MLCGTVTTCSPCSLLTGVAGTSKESVSCVEHEVVLFGQQHLALPELSGYPSHGG